MPDKNKIRKNAVILYRFCVRVGAAAALVAALYFYFSSVSLDQIKNVLDFFIFA